jgi:uncharacterized membrane protein
MTAVCQAAVPSFRGVGGTVESLSVFVSADGSTAVGQSRSTLGLQGFRWTQGGGILGLGDLPGRSFHSFATCISGDGPLAGACWTSNSK